MLSAIVAVTLLVPDVGAAERAYEATLDYQAVEHGRIEEAQARSWGAERLAGRHYVLLQPASHEPVYLRLVDSDGARPAAVLTRLGWSATEVLVQDPPALAARMSGSDFRIVGPPAPLDFNPAVVAMQAIGPAGEMFYFTRIPEGQSRFGLGAARSFVDRTFIVVEGVHDLRQTLDFYAQTFGLPVTAPSATRVDVLARASGLPTDHKFQIALARLPQRFLIEVDEYPERAIPPRSRPGELPAGMAMVSFEVPSLDPYLGRLVGPPARAPGAPYDGRRAGVLLGPSGERIELVEAAAGAAITH